MDLSDLSVLYEGAKVDTNLIKIDVQTKLVGQSQNHFLDKSQIETSSLK